MASRKSTVVGVVAALVAGIAGAELFRFLTTRHSWDLGIAAIAVGVLVLIVTGNWLTSRRRGEPPR